MKRTASFRIIGREGVNLKILYVATVGGSMLLFKSFVRTLLGEGNIVDIACGNETAPVPDCYTEWGCKIFRLSCSRSPLNKGNINAFKELSEIVSNGGYDIVHCHTPIAGAVTRLACRKYRKDGLKVIYTAHGFHFYKGAPLKNWLIYYPIEKFCSHFTDVLITINHEDYELAKKKMRAKRVEYVPGVGIDVDKFANTVVDRTAKRRELGIPEDAFLLLSVGELNENKNHQIVIRALAELQNQNVHYMVAGEGPLHDFLLDLAQELKVADQVHLLGFRNDVAELYKTADVDVFPSNREGLGLAAVEGMVAGLSLICSDNRGTREYAKNGENAVVCSNSVAEYASAIDKLYRNESLRIDYGNHGATTAHSFNVASINDLMMKIYQSEMGTV